MLVAAGVCPHPPLIVPQLAGAAAAELDDLRTACAAAIQALVSAGPDLLVVVGSADHTADYPMGASGTLRPWGVDVRTGSGIPVLPLSLTVGRWLLDQSGVSAGSFTAIASDASSEECAEIGHRLAGLADRVALLVMGDGSARLTEKSPGYLHPAAEPYQRDLSDAIAAADMRRLAAMDPAEAAELWVGGRAVFQVLGAAATPGGWIGEMRYDAAPYGVAYLVATWAPACG
jgi:hypothetical protein